MKAMVKGAGSETMEPVLVPIEEHPAVVAAREAAVEAERACREAGERLAQARQAAGTTFTESRGPGRIFTALDTWAARRDLPECERAFAEAQARREVTAADLAAAQAQAQAALVPHVQAQLRPRLAALRDALQAVVPALDALDGAVRALEARGVAVAPIVPVINSAAAIRAFLVPYATAIEGGLAEPAPPRLPRDHVLVTIRRRVWLRPDGSLPRGEDGRVLLGDLRGGLHDLRGGAFNFSGETVGVPEATAKVLVGEGIAEMVA